MTVRIKIGPNLAQMTDEAVLLLFNQCTVATMRKQDELDPFVAVEIPPGSPQVLAKPDIGFFCCEKKCLQVSNQCT